MTEEVLDALREWVRAEIAFAGVADEGGVASNERINAGISFQVLKAEALE